ncbi:MAG: O-antigen ligase family protein [Elusimicrobia bacterium]|nr:O-antigen ligase family protein [Elusimicrobiota bacterium]
MTDIDQPLTIHPKDFLLFLPLLTAPSLYGLAPKVTGPFILCFIAAVILAASMLSAKRRFEAVDIRPWGALIVYCLCSAWRTTSWMWEQALGIAVCLVFGCLLIERVNEDAACSPERVRGIRFLAVAGAWIVSCIWIGARWIFSHSEARHLALANQNILAVYLGLILPTAIEFWLEENRNRDGRIFWFYGGVVAIAAVSLLSSRSMVGAVALMGLVIGARRLLKERFGPKIFILAAMLGVLFFAMAIGGSTGPQSLTQRLHWTRAGWLMFLDHPLLGVAHLGGFASAYPIYHGDSSGLRSILSHNAAVEYLCQYGLIGVFLICWLIYSCRHLYLRRRPFSWSLSATLWIFALSGIFESSHFLLPIFLVFVALTASHASLNKSAAQKPAGNAGGVIVVVFCAMALFSGAATLTLGRAALMQSGAWVGMMAVMPGTAEKEIDRELKASLRWDSQNPETWSQRGYFEYLISRVAPVRRPYALWAGRMACRIEPFRKGQWKLLKMMAGRDEF